MRKLTQDDALRSTLRDNGLCVRYTPAWHLSEPTVPCRFQFQKFPALRFSALLIDGAQEEVRFERVALGQDASGFDSSKIVHMGDALSFLWEQGFIVTGQGCRVRAQDRYLPSFQTRASYPTAEQIREVRNGFLSHALQLHP